MKSLPYIFLFTVLATIMGCKKELPNGMKAGYFKIIDDPASDNRYKVLDVKETNDGGSLILASINHTQGVIIRLNDEGEYVASSPFPGNSKNPLPSMLKVGSTFYAACMDEVGLFTRLLQIDEHSGAVAIAGEFTNLLYPLAFSTDGNSILLLGYDRYTFSSQLSLISPNGQISWHANINVFQDVEAEIVAHLNGTGKTYPFYTAYWNGKYIVNGFSNYSFSFLAYSAGQQFPDAIYNGSHFLSGTSGFYAMENGNAAIARFSFGKSYLIPSFSYSGGTVSLTDDMGGILMEDAADNSDFRFANVSIDQTNYICFAYNTKNGRCAVGFLGTGGELKAKKFFGSGENPFSIGNFTQTADKGLLVAGTFSVAGSFPRPAVFKLNEKELYSIMGLEYDK